MPFIFLRTWDANILLASFRVAGQRLVGSRSVWFLSIGHKVLSRLAFGLTSTTSVQRGPRTHQDYIFSASAEKIVSHFPGAPSCTVHQLFAQRSSEDCSSSLHCRRRFELRERGVLAEFSGGSSQVDHVALDSNPSCLRDAPVLNTTESSVW